MVKSASKSSKLASYKNKNSQVAPSKLTGSIVTIAVSTALLYYLYNLEQKHCNCIRDWRHTYIKFYAWVILLINLAELFQAGFSIRIITTGSTNTIVIITVIVLLLLLALVTTNSYAIFTYVRDLNDTHCACAEKEMASLNKVMLVLRWFYIIGAAILALMYADLALQISHIY